MLAILQAVYETHHVCSFPLALGAVYTEIRKTPRHAVQLNPLPANYLILSRPRFFFSA